MFSSVIYINDPNLSTLHEDGQSQPESTVLCRKKLLYGTDESYDVDGAECAETPSKKKRSPDLTVQAAYLETVEIQQEELLNDTVYFEAEEIQKEQSLSDTFEELHRLKVENNALQEKLNILQANQEQNKGLIEKLREENHTMAVTTSKLQFVEKELAMKTLMLKEMHVQLNNLKKTLRKELAFKDNMTPTAQLIFNNERINAKKNSRGQRFSDDIRNLAINLSFYSNQGYKKLRTIFRLPSISSIRRYLAPVGCASGILKNALAEIQQQIKDGLHGAEATLSLDEMAIKKGIHWDVKLKKYFGFDEFSNKEQSETDDSVSSMATQALVFYIVGLDGKWKTPVAYYFTNHIDGTRLGGLLKEVLKATHEFGIIVRSVVFDGLAANVGMTTELGANLKYSSSSMPTKTARTGRRAAALKKKLTCPFKPNFVHPSTGEPVNVLLDACHMLKLARNLLSFSPVKLPGYQDPAQWKYIKALFQFQNEAGFRLGNRLTRQHAYFERHKMKVALAAQVLSRSVADVLRHLREVLKVPQVTSQY